MGAVAPARRPLFVEPGKIGFERTAANAEDVRPLTAKHLSHQAAAVAGASHDLLDRRAFFGHREDGGVGLFAAEVAFILQLLGGGEQGGIDRGGANRAPNLAHRFPHRVEESVACVLHQMPAVGDLHRVGQRLLRRQGIAAASIPSHDGDLRLAAQPRLGGRGFSIWQQRDRLSAFEITDQRSIAMVATPGPVVDPDDHRGCEGRAPVCARPATGCRC